HFYDQRFNLFSEVREVEILDNTNYSFTFSVSIHITPNCPIWRTPAQHRYQCFIYDNPVSWVRAKISVKESACSYFQSKSFFGIKGYIVKWQSLAFTVFISFKLISIRTEIVTNNGTDSSCRNDLRMIRHL